MRARITISVDEETVDRARHAVAAGTTPSISAWAAEAMDAKARQESLRSALSELRAELGPATDEETAWARSVLGL